MLDQTVTEPDHRAAGRDRHLCAAPPPRRGVERGELRVVPRHVPFGGRKGSIVEVNAAPGLRMHLYPSEGRSRRVGEAIVDMLFPSGAPSRVPLVAVTGRVNEGKP